jgi:cytochrome c-type biogenesis protein CcmH
LRHGSSKATFGVGGSALRLTAGLVFLALLPAALAFAAERPGSRLGVDTASLLGRPAGRPLAGDELDRATEAVASKMRCPVCQGLSVADSPTGSAQAMKAEVREFLAAGYSPDQVLDYFEGSYGEFIRLAPKTQGFNLMVWLAPLVVLAGGAALILARVRRPVGSGANGAAEGAELAEYVARVRREVGE